MAKQAIEAVPAQAPRYGLLVAADIVEDDARWQAGVVWSPEGCGGPGRSAAVDCAGSTPNRDDDDFEQPPNAEADAFLVYALDRCSSIGWRAHDYEGRARRALLATQSASVAREFWTGALSLAEGLDNVPLADASADTVTATSGPVSALDALALLEGALAACGAGRRGMIHVTPQILVLLYAARAVEQAGQQIVTPLGTIVVGDAGYDGSGPNGEDPGATQWAYATSMVQVRLSPVEIPGTLEGARRYAQQMRRDVNTIEVYSQRLALVQWDSCCHIAAQIDVDVPLTGGAS